MAVKIRRSPGEIVFDWGNVLFMLAVCFVTLYPFWYSLVLALNDAQDARLGGIWFWPRRFTLQNLVFMLGNSQLKTAYLNTILRTALGSVYALMLTGLAAYAATKRHLVGQRGILLFLTIPLFIGGTIVSNYVVMAKLGLLNRFAVYILPFGFSYFFMIVMRTFMDGLPASLEESAKIDGAGYTRIFFSIIFPLCTPVVAAVLLFNAIGHWLDLSANLIYVSKRSLTTAQYLLYLIWRSSQVSASLAMEATRTGNISVLKQSQVTPESIKHAALVIVTVPILFIYPFFQRYFIKGMLVGAVKE